ncbi:metallophosphoesterase [Sandaracinobacteroides hominis]|uniref:metallophosphoesterase n=1 Tax=Sandaracinobacteroides hominis TaxID=2780086 RepID=UPI0018F74EAD|nr:metallophosphoesterase [Sandaracinobacteroides hominis]
MRTLARLFAALAAAALVFLGVGYWNATRPPIVVAHEQRLPGLPPGSRIRVAVFADTHYGFPDMSGERLRGIVAQVNALKPDLILLAGDYHGGKLLDLAPSPRMEPAVEPFAALKAPLGVFAVMGNHDNSRWAPVVFAKQGEPKLLVNQRLDVGPLVVAGANSVAHGSNIAGTLAGPGLEKPVLLILHEGDQLSHEERPPGLHILAFAGHTHGGQIILPFVGNVGKKVLGNSACWRGPCTINGWPIIVTSGIGTSWLPIRYGVPPEILLITLTP